MVVRDKKLDSALKRANQAIESARKDVKSASILNVHESGFMQPENEREKTYKVKQSEILHSVDSSVASKALQLNNLDEFGPYTFDFTRNGVDLLLGGHKGHISVMNWKSKALKSEWHVREPVRAVQWLHNNQLLAVAQRKYVYMYDSDGVEVHCLKKHIDVNCLNFLPYHFLLVSGGQAGFLKYQDVATGQLVAELRTKMGPVISLTQNPYNAVEHVGHTNGTVSLWSPASTSSLAQILAHRGPVRSIAFDRQGHYMVTAGADMQVKVWDIRQFKEVNSYFVRGEPKTLSVSDRGLLAIGYGPHVTVWKDALRKKQQSPYMDMLVEGSSVQNVQFCPHEDFLGVSHTRGFQTMIIPGSGEPNFDSYEVNPYETSKQRRETEVRQLLEKLKPEMISLDPDMVASVDPQADKTRLKHWEKDAIEQERHNAQFKVNADVKSKNSRLRKHLRKKMRNLIDERKMRAETLLRREKALRAKKHLGEAQVVESKYGPALERFVTKAKDTF